jgi:hypothetical protein
MTKALVHERELTGERTAWHEFRVSAGEANPTISVLKRVGKIMKENNYYTILSWHSGFDASEDEYTYDVLFGVSW